MKPSPRRPVRRRELGFDAAKVNPNGSGTGASIRVKAVYELKRSGRYALVTMCIAGGQGIAAIFERAWHAGAMRPATGQLVAHQPCSLFLSE